MNRYTCGDLRLIPYKWPDGEWVLYVDHKAEVKAAVEREREACAIACIDAAQKARTDKDEAGYYVCADVIRARQKHTTPSVAGRTEL